ncbi:MAG: ATP-grasp domain-containing protein [Vulcanimicrobiaceae bacterium]
MTGDAAIENAHGIHLRAAGNVHAAIAVFAHALEKHPNVVELALNLAQTQYEAGDNDRAIAAFERALSIDPKNVAAHMTLWELMQIKGDMAAALSHQRSALASQRLFTAIAPHQTRSILLLCAPGDWQANIPVDFLFDRSSTTSHKLYLLEGDSPPRDLPAHDVLWNTIAESAAAMPYLDLAKAFMRDSPRPCLNAPASVIATARMHLPATLRDADCSIAPIEEISRAALARGQNAFAYPIISRPIGSHAGLGLERIESGAEIAGYLERVRAPAFFISPFVDYRSQDGLFRKYRVVFVDGEPYPVHLAISPRWMIHYYNADMAENAWMRDEEAAFLADIQSVFSGAAYEALLSIAVAVGLEYFGIDCALGPDGRILVFEADPAMLVHSSDPIELYPYKHRFIPNIYRAVERMIDRRKAAAT